MQAPRASSLGLPMVSLVSSQPATVGGGGGGAADAQLAANKCRTTGGANQAERGGDQDGALRRLAPARGWLNREQGEN